MPTTRQSRLMIAKMMLRLMQHYSAAVFEDPHYGKNAQDIIIMLGVAVGHHEGKPMTAAKLSEYVCVPRATVIRRVSVMIKRELLVLNERKQVLLSEKADKKAANAAPRLTKPAIVHTAVMLSKLDTNTLASGKRQ